MRLRHSRLEKKLKWVPTTTIMPTYLPKLSSIAAKFENTFV